MTKEIYLDYAAATPVDPAVLEVMQPYFADKFYNPSAAYLAAQKARSDLNRARAAVAACLGAKPAEIVFTAGATEANNLAIQGIMHQYPGGEVLVGAVEHESVLAPARLFRHQEIPVDKQGRVLLSKLETMITDKTVLVSAGLVNNELGTIQPLAEIAKLLNKLNIARRANGNRLPLLLHTDAAQAGNYLDLHVSRLEVDLMSLNGGKIYGPKQSGGLYIKAGVKLQPLIVGGGQESGLRSGTQNVAAAVGFAKALELAQNRRPAEVRRIKQLRDLFAKQLQSQLPELIFNHSVEYGIAHILSVTFPGRDNERLMMELDEQGIECAVGSACSASRQEASHVLSAIGLSDELARATLRFSLGRQTTQKDIDKATEQLQQLLKSRP